MYFTKEEVELMVALIKDIGLIEPEVDYYKRLEFQAKLEDWLKGQKT